MIYKSINKKVYGIKAQVLLKIFYDIVQFIFTCIFVIIIFSKTGNKIYHYKK